MWGITRENGWISIVLPPIPPGPVVVGVHDWRCLRLFWAVARSRDSETMDPRHRCPTSWWFWSKVGDTRWCPSSLAKLVNITPIKPMVYGRYNELVHGVYKPTYNWGAPSCKHTKNHGTIHHAIRIGKPLENHGKIWWFISKITMLLMGQSTISTGPWLLDAFWCFLMLFVCLPEGNMTLLFFG